MSISNVRIDQRSEYLWQRDFRQVTARVQNGRRVDTPAVEQEPPPARSDATPPTQARSILNRLPDSAFPPALSLGDIRRPVAQNAQAVPLAPVSDTSAENTAENPLDESALDWRLYLLKALVERLSGQLIELFEIDTAVDTGETQAPTPTAPTAPATAPTGDSVSVSFSVLEEFEYSAVSFSGSFDIDGQTVELSLSFSMVRYYRETELEVLIEKGLVKDPLALNFNGSSVTLDSNGTPFDLDSDGSAEQLPGLSQGNAWLALDRDGDGAIGNGRELFGPQSGNGFAELAQFDEDGNQFIDDGDSVFSQLLAYRPGESAAPTLKSLGVTAIFLGAAESTFHLNDSRNETLGMVRATSFYLMASGSAGTVQQVDVVT